MPFQGRRLAYTYELVGQAVLARQSSLGLITITITGRLTDDPDDE